MASTECMHISLAGSGDLAQNLRHGGVVRVVGVLGLADPGGKNGQAMPGRAHRAVGGADPGDDPAADIVGPGGHRHDRVRVTEPQLADPTGGLRRRVRGERGEPGDRRGLEAGTASTSPSRPASRPTARPGARALAAAPKPRSGTSRSCSDRADQAGSTAVQTSAGLRGAFLADHPGRPVAERQVVQVAAARRRRRSCPRPRSGAPPRARPGTPTSGAAATEYTTQAVRAAAACTATSPASGVAAMNWWWPRLCHGSGVRSTRCSRRRPGAGGPERRRRARA